MVIISIYTILLNSSSIATDGERYINTIKEATVICLEKEYVDKLKSATPDTVLKNVYSTKDQIKKVMISVAGDCTLGTDQSFSYFNSFPYELEHNGNDYSYFLSNVKKIFQMDDFTLVNLETTFTDSDEKVDKQFRFKGNPLYVNILKEGNIEAVNIANNHINDYLLKGYDDTVKTLIDSNILYFNESNIAYYKNVDLSIACLGYTGWDTSIKETIKKDIEKAKKESDLVLISFHWGIERSNYPNEVQKELARFSIDSGADLVWGHHPHVIQGIEKYKNKYIVYSLGNFCFGGNFNPNDKDTFIFQNEFTFQDKEITFNKSNIIPCSISSVNYRNDYRPTILIDNEKKRVLNRIYEYSSKLEYGIKK